jgi:hypothetical protein
MIINRVVTCLFLLAFMLAAGPKGVLADGDRGESWQVETEEVVSSQNDQGMKNHGENQGGEGIMDPRLPPVIPGEEVIRQGKRIRVISTSGPIPLRERKLERRDSSYRYQPEGVIVDMRDRFKDRHSDRFRSRDRKKNYKGGSRSRDRDHYLDRRRRR